MSDNRYRNDMGNIETIWEMHLSEIVNEINERLTALEVSGNPIDELNPQIDPRIIELFDAEYAVQQALYTPASTLRKEHCSFVLISIAYSEKVILSFDVKRDKFGYPHSKAHEYLQTLRNMCQNLEVMTLSEKQYIHDVDLETFYNTEYQEDWA